MNNNNKNNRLNELPSYTGEFNGTVNIHYINYSANGLVEKQLNNADEFTIDPNDNNITWIRVRGMNDPEPIVGLVERTGLSMLDAKDILTTQHIMIVEEYENNLFIVMPVIYYLEGELIKEQLAFIMGANYLLTIQESDNPLFENIFQSLKKSNYQKFNSRKTDFLLATMINEIINYYGDYVMQIEDKLEDLEDELLDIKQTRHDLITDIQESRREVIRLRKLLFPFKEQMAELLRIDSGLIRPQEMAYFKDIYDQLLYILQNIESCREILSSLVDLYLNNNDVKMNLAMKQLTMVATIFIPLTFLVGVWGMNFSFMPELDWRYGYLLAWVLMIGIGVGLWIYLRKKDKNI